MTQHDTPEAVEHTEANLALLGCIAAAAMLRRLHQRAVDAERERDHWRAYSSGQGRLIQSGIFITSGDYQAALATARADALREAAKVLRQHWEDLACKTGPDGMPVRTPHASDQQRPPRSASRFKLWL